MRTRTHASGEGRRRGGMAQTALGCSSEGVSVSWGWVVPQTT